MYYEGTVLFEGAFKFVIVCHDFTEIRTLPRYVLKTHVY